MMDKWTALVVFSISVISIAYSEPPAEDTGSLPPRPPGAWNATWTDRLKKHLLNQYDKYARPAEHTNTTVVSINLSITHVNLDELTHIMIVQGWTRMTWMDEKLKWNESEYGGLKVLHVMPHEVWQPDVVVYNSATAHMIEYYGNTHCLVYPTGYVLWVPPSEFQTYCDMDLRLWPYDTQTCIVKIGSWTYDGEKLDLKKYESQDIDEDNLIEVNSEWKLVGLTSERNEKTYPCCEEPYPDITYTFKLQRTSPSYKAMITSPATVLALIIVATFLLPPGAGEKILLNVCAAIITTIFLMYFAHKLPAMGNHTPYVVCFYVSTLYMACTAIIVSVIVVTLARTQQSLQLPYFIKHQLTGYLGQTLLLGDYIKQATSMHHMASSPEELRDQDHKSSNTEDRQTITNRFITSNHYDWLLLAAFVDRIMIIVFGILFTLLAINYM